MPTPAQAGAAVATAGVLSAGSYGIYHYSTSGEEQKIDPTEPLQGLVTFTSSEDLTAYNNGTLKLLKSSNIPHIVKSAPTENKKWWDWDFESKYKKETDASKKKRFFADIDKGWGEASDNKALNNACEKAYKQEVSNFDAYISNAEAISAFCTKSRTNVTEPASAIYGAADATSITSTYPNGVLSVENNRPKLVKTTENKYWWKWAYSKRVTEESKKTFTTLFKGVGNEGFNANVQTALNKKCDEAYKKNRDELQAADNNSTIIKDIEKLCSLDPKSNLDLPVKAPAQKPTGNIAKLSNTDTTSSGAYVGKLVSLLNESNLVKLIKPVADDNTQKWWKWAYENKFSKHTDKGTLDPIFSKVEEGYAASAKAAKGQAEVNQIALNQACHKAYEQLEAKYEFGAEKHLLNNIGEFCNGADGKEDISEPKSATYTTAETNYENGVLGIDANRTHLVKTTKGDSDKLDLWWKWSFNKNFDKVQKNTLYDSVFHQVDKDYGETEHQHLNKACDAAYKKTYNDFKNATSKLLSSISKLCTKGLTAQPLDKPEPSPTEFVIAKDSSSSYTGDLLSSTHKDANKNNLVDPNKGDDWWNWSYETRVAKYTDKSKIPSIFASVQKGHDTTEKGTEGKREALKFACKEAYGKDKTALKEITGTKKLVDFVKEFCAIKSTTSLKYTEN